MFQTSKIHNLLLISLACLSIGLSVLYPLQLPPWRSFIAEWWFALFVLFGLAALTAAKHPIQVPFSYGVTAIAAITLSSSFISFGLNHEHLWVLVYLLLCWCAYILGTNSRNSEIVGPLIALVLAVVAASIIGLSQHYGILQESQLLKDVFYIEKNSGRMFTSIGQPNRYGVMAAVSAFLCLWLMSETTKQWAKALLLVCVAVCMQGVVASQSRSAFLGLVLSTILLVLTVHLRANRFHPLGIFTCLTPILFYAVFSVINAVFLDQQTRAIPLAQEGLYSDPQRLRIWMLGLQAIAGSPWLGYGPGSIPTLALEFSPQFGAFAYKILTHLHNTPLDLLVEFGLPIGGVIVFLFYGWWIRSVLGKLSNQKAVIACATVPVLIHSLLEYPLYYGNFLWLLFWLLGFTNAAQDMRPQQKAKQILIKRSSALTLTTSLLVASFLVFHAYLGVERMYTWARNDRMGEARVAAEQPSTLQVLLFGGLVKRISWVTTEVGPDSRMTPAQIADLESSARAHPQYLLVWRSAVANAANGRPDQAAWWAERLCHMFEPASCKAAQELWESVGHPEWPKLQWELWPRPTSPRPGEGMP